MSEDRKSRELETRDAHQSHDDDWRPPELLPSVPPDGEYRYRWLRKSLNGDLDARNIGLRRQEGWVLCSPEDQPEIAMMSDASALENGNIEIGGLVLAKMPERKARQRDQYYAQKAEQQVTGLSADMNTNAGADARMPIIQQRQTTTSRNPV